MNDHILKFHTLPKNRVKKSVHKHNWNELKETKNGRIDCIKSLNIFVQEFQKKLKFTRN